MIRTARQLAWTLALVSTFAALACSGGGSDEDHAGSSGKGEAAVEAASNRVDIPPAVRSNLGISFVTVERRRVEKTLRVPGSFELLPTARREYRTMLPGKVELLVEQYQPVEPGEALYHIDSPAWREMQQQLFEAESAISRLTTRLETFEPLQTAHIQHELSLVASIEIWDERITQLESIGAAGGGRVGDLAAARSAHAMARAELAQVQETKAELTASRSQTFAELAAARSRRSFLLDSAASLIGLDREVLATMDSSDRSSRPRWATIREITVSAVEEGVVESFGLTNGSWADERVAVLTVMQPDRLQFRAYGLQSDLGVLRDGLFARIVPPTPTTGGTAVSLQETMEGTLALGLTNNSRDRTVDLYVRPKKLLDWARPGVAAQLEIVIDSTAALELAIPVAAIQRDGILPVIFRRAPDDPNKAIRMEADLGVDDGRWITVRSGLRDGDQIILDGAFQLMLATSGSMQKGGHFHSDGTFHEGED